MKRNPELSIGQSGGGRVIVLAITCLAGLLVAAFFLLLPGQPRTSDAFAGGVPPQGPAAAPSDEEPLAEGSPNPQESTRSPELQNRVALEPSDTDPGEPLGTILIHYPDGGQETQASGELILRPMDGEAEGAEVLVSFQQGRFSLQDLPEGRIRVKGASTSTKAGGRPVAFPQPEFMLQRGEALLLQGHYFPDSKLYVVDAQSGAELDHIRVLPKLPKHAGPEQSHPGAFHPFEQSIENGTSPATLPWKPGVQSYWVSAKGYAWSFLQIDHETGGDRYVQLEQSGGLVIRVVNLDSIQLEGPDQALDLRVRVYHADTLQLASAYRLGEEAGRRGIYGLAVGPYLARVEVGADPSNPVVLGETPVEITPFETKTIEVHLEGARIQPPVLVRGKLVLPPEAQRLELSLSIRPAEGPALRPGDQKLISHGSMQGGWDTEERHWSANHLTPGRYLFVVEPIGHSVLVDVPNRPLEDVTIALPELFPVTLYAVDSNSKEPIPEASFQWAKSEAGLEGAERWTPVSSMAGEGGATVYLPEGPFTFTAASPIHGERSMRARVENSKDSFTIELSAYLPREVVLMHGDTVIPWPPGTSAEFSVMGSEDSHPFEQLEGGKRRAWFDHPGPHEITLGSIEGFQQPEPAVVSVDASDSSPIYIQLIR